MQYRSWPYPLKDDIHPHLWSYLWSCSCRILNKRSANFSSAVLMVAANASLTSHFILLLCTTKACPTPRELPHWFSEKYGLKITFPVLPHNTVRKICCLTLEKIPLLIDSWICLADYNSPTYPYVIHTHTSALASTCNCYSIQTG